MENSSVHVNLTSQTANKSTYVAVLIIIPVAIVTFALNLLSLIILRKSKKLRKNKFHFLAICLSATNITASIGCCILIANTLLNIHGFRVPFICYSSSLITTLTVLCSLLQIFFICVERLIATFSLPTNNIWKSKLNVFIVTSLLSAFSYTICLFAMYGKTTSTSCRTIDIFNENYRKFLLVTSYVRFTLYIVIVAVYVIILCRLRKIVNQVLPVNTIIELRSENKFTSHVKGSTDNSHKSAPVASSSHTLSEVKSTTMRSTNGLHSLECIEPRTQTSLMSNINVTQSSAYKIPQSSTNETSYHGATLLNNRSENRMLRFRKTIFTLGSIIAMVTLTGFPCVITNLLYAADNRLVSPAILEFTNILILLNPLSDPIIYVFRIKEYRKILRCQTHG